jgi:hypothetical protein
MEQRDRSCRQSFEGTDATEHYGEKTLDEEPDAKPAPVSPVNAAPRVNVTGVDGAGRSSRRCMSPSSTRADDRLIDGPTDREKAAEAMRLAISPASTTVTP